MKLLKKLVAVALAATFGTAGAADLRILQASYGVGCDPILHGNMTKTVKKACTKKALCRFTIDAATQGDPAPMCKKNFVVDYRCGANGVTKTAAVAAEASTQYVTLDCSR